jgi:hypothetical protein
VGRTSGYLVLDIETVPDGRLWRRPDGPGHSLFPPPYAHRIIVLGSMWLDEEYRLQRLGVLGTGREEAGIIEDFSSFVERHRPALVTYNGRGFDLPVIAMRSLHHGIQMPWYYEDRALRSRYSEEGHIDICDWLADHGAARSGSLDALARLIGLPGKLGIDGSQVEGLYRSGDPADLLRIENYCLSDVAQTGLLFLRFRLLQGVLDPLRHRRVVDELLAGLRAEPRLAELMAAVDQRRLVDGAPEMARSALSAG